LAAAPFASCGGQPVGGGDFTLIAESMGEVPMHPDALKIDNLAKAYDGSMATRWTTGAYMEPGFFIEIRFSRPRKVAGLVLNSEPSPLDFPRRFTVEASGDGKNWEEVARGGPKKTKNGITTIDFKQAREVRSVIVTVNKAADFWWSIYELQIKYAD
jgi:endo-1,3(4)-beta-glucanase